MKLIDAVAQVLEEDPKTRRQEYLWAFFVKVLNKLDHKAYIEFKKGMPSPESIIRERRNILNNPINKEKYGNIRGKFVPEENTTYEKPGENPESITNHT